MSKLTVKTQYLESSICYQRNGSPYNIVLKEASQQDLEILKETGKGDFDHLFESEPKPVKEK